jgi:hypothetical protein
MVQGSKSHVIEAWHKMEGMFLPRSKGNNFKVVMMIVTVFIVIVAVVVIVVVIVV